MGTFSLRIRLSDQALADLKDAIADEKEEFAEGQWLFRRAIKPILKSLAETRNLLFERGSLVLPNDKKLDSADVTPLALESDPEGNVEMVLGERTKARVELSAGYVSVTNRLMGQPARWATSREWVVENCLAEIARATAKAEVSELRKSSKSRRSASRRTN